jgi:hypothetical protein
MKIVPFPQREGPAPDAQALARIEAALHGVGDDLGFDEATTAERASAVYWRQLRADVRELAPPMSDEFVLRLHERIEAREAKSPRRISPRFSLARLRAWLGSGARARVAALGGICTMAAIVTLALVAPWQGSEQVAEEMLSHPVSVKSSSSSPASGELEASSGSSDGSETAVEEAAPARVQQRAASLTLAPKPEAVQSVADEAAQLAVREGGFVQSSQVRRQRGAGASAELRLSLPSARLTGALASLGRLAPVRAESQSLQDITDEYGASRRKLADAVAERQALLRALARAATQTQVESLRKRIALAAAAITRARAAFGVISRRGSNSTVEVSVLGDAHAATASRSTLEDGLRDALNVLKAALAVLLVALAVLVPLSLVLVVSALGWRASRRRLRERALS